MTEPLIRHEDVAGYLLGSLTPQEQAAFERHLAGCAWCRRQMDDLSAPAELFRQAAPDYDMPAALEAPDACRRRAERLGERITPGAACPPDCSGLGVWCLLPPRPQWSPSACSWSRPSSTAPVRGEQIELEAVLAPPAGGPERATVVVEKTGIGREISFRSDDLPILPQGEYYELWFVGPGDTLRRPNRISAGTFHPDEQGRSVVELTAAVDPLLYPILSVTAEPADGNPQRTGPEVLRSRSELTLELLGLGLRLQLFVAAGRA